MGQLFSVETTYNKRLNTQLSLRSPPVLFSKLTKLPLIHQFGFNLTPLHVASCFKAKSFVQKFVSQFLNQETSFGVSALILSVVFNSFDKVLWAENGIMLKKQTLDMRCGATVMDFCNKFGNDVTNKLINEVQRGQDTLSFQQAIRLSVRPASVSRYQTQKQDINAVLRSPRPELEFSQVPFQQRLDILRQTPKNAQRHNDMQSSQIDVGHSVLQSQVQQPNMQDSVLKARMERQLQTKSQQLQKMCQENDLQIGQLLYEKTLPTQEAQPEKQPLELTTDDKLSLVYQTKNASQVYTLLKEQTQAQNALRAENARLQAQVAAYQQQELEQAKQTASRAILEQECKSLQQQNTILEAKVGQLELDLRHEKELSVTKVDAESQLQQAQILELQKQVLQGEEDKAGLKEVNEEKQRVIDGLVEDLQAANKRYLELQKQMSELEIMVGALGNE